MVLNNLNLFGRRQSVWCENANFAFGMEYHEMVSRLSGQYAPGEARALVRLVLEERYGLSLADVYSGKVTELSRDDQAELEKIIVRLENGAPVQYVLGHEWFCGHRFSVAPGVLIPRPETEELVELALKACETDLPTCADGVPHIIDIGTGSGCIAVSIALAMHERGQRCRVEGWDISREALSIAQRNAEQLGAEVAFREVDILAFEHVTSAAENAESASVHAETVPPEGLRASLIVSNPPYIVPSEAAQMHRNVLDHEPHTALFVPEDDPLLFYRAITGYARKVLLPGGWLLFEVNRAYGENVCELLRTSGFGNVVLQHDQFGNARMASARFATVNN